MPRALREATLPTEQIFSLPDDAPEWLQQRWEAGDRNFQRFSPDERLSQEVQHIADWVAVLAQEPGAEQEAPRILTTISTLAEATARADAHMAKTARALQKITLESQAGTEVVKTYPTGYTMVRLLTREALDYESQQMGHCIGGGAYDARLASGEGAFYSLRDAQNRPHVTLEIDKLVNSVLQCQGKENHPPAEKYRPHVIDFITDQQWRLKALPADTGLVQADDGAYHSIDNLPEHLTIGGSLDLSNSAFTALPDNLTCGGGLDLH